MATPVDLKQLAVQRRDETVRPLVRKRPWITRWGIPFVIIFGFLGVIGWSARDRWLPQKPVTVTPVVMMRAEVQASGTPLFQAAGWVEPRPTPVMVSALVEGVVDKLLVVEGQDVKAGDPVAQLFDADSRLALREAQATKQLREAELAVHHATLKAAQKHVEAPVHLEAALAEAEAALAKVETELNNLPFAVRTAESRLNLAQQDFAGKQRVADALPGRLLQRSQSDLDAANATVDELKQRKPSLEAEKTAWQRKCAALKQKLELKTEEVRALEEAKANVSASQARLLQSELAVESSQLRLERMTIRAPLQGRVLALNAHPGRRVMGINAASERDASTVISMYDPRQLQVRADVRLENVAQVQIGQPVQISTDAYNQPLSGHVLTVTSSADIQKNTLQIKVAINDPPAVIKPEMLMQVVFLAPQKPEETTAAQDPLRLLIPRDVIQKTEEGVLVWVVDASTGVAKKRIVQLGQAGTEELVEVTSGLTALDKLIVSGREGMVDGERIKIAGEDHTLGTSRESTSTSAVKSTTTTK